LCCNIHPSRRYSRRRSLCRSDAAARTAPHP
jgi:hypothetical protein